MPASTSALLTRLVWQPRVLVNRNNQNGFVRLHSAVETDNMNPTMNETISTTKTNENFQIVYTCNKCDTRNLVNIHKVAWASGVVITTCQGCYNRHLLSDMKGRLDIGNTTQFSNVANAIGATTVNPRSLDAKTLESLGLDINDDGTVQLVPRVDEEFLSRKEKVSAVGKKNRTKLETSFDAPTPSVAVGEDTAQKGEQEQLTTNPVLEITVPNGASSGDILQVETALGLMFVPVPEGVKPDILAKLAVEGCIEFMAHADHVGSR
jgi:hypothetical protein